MTLTGNPTANDMFYRAAVSTKIEDAGDGNYRIDDLWTIRLKTDEKPAIRDSNGKKELLVPVKFTNNKAVIVQDYLW